MTNQTQNAVSTPAIKKFEVGKTYAAKKSVLFDSQINMTVINRTNCYVTFQFDDDEDDIRRCKIVDDAGVEKIYLHESNVIGGDYEFSANDEVTETLDTVENETAADEVNDSDEVKADETQGYIFTTTKAYSGCSWQAAHYSKLERIDYRCKILGDSEHFDGSLYREVVFYDPDRAHAWAVKTADGKVIISGHDKPDFDKIVEAVKAYENTEVTETVNEKFTTVKAENEIARFEVGRRYRGKLDCGTKKIDCTIEVIKRTAKCIVYPTGGNTNPFCTKIKCSDTSEYISPASGLFVKASDVVIEPQPPTVDEPKIDSDASIVEVADTLNELDAAEYAITEEAFNVALDAEIELAAKTDEPETVNSEIDSAEVAKFEVGKRYSGKAYKLEKRWGKYRRSEPFDTTILVTKRTNSFVYAALAGNENYPAAYKIRTDATSEYIDYGHGHYFKAADKADEGNTVTDETPAETDGYDESAFDLLPTVDELNDCRSDIEKEFDEFDAKYTDRDARFNHGERHAEKLTAKLREIDPTVEVTYDINEDGEDVFYLRFGKYVYRSPFATLDAVEETFHLWREDDEPTETKPTVDDQKKSCRLLTKKKT